MKKKGGKGVPPISTASLPDVIFMILFFFMVSTTMREQEVLVKTVLPDATEVQKLEKKTSVSYIHVGPPTPAMVAQFGEATRVQLDGDFQDVSQIYAFVDKERNNITNEMDKVTFTVCIKSDSGVKMGTISDIKQELRKANALKVSYVARDANKKGSK